MPTPTYTPLATVTLGSSASSITFSSIPATYRDLIIVADGSASGGENCRLTLNADTTDANYSNVSMYGTGSSAASGSGASRAIVNFYTGKGSHIIQLMDYSATDKHTTAIARSNTPATLVWASAYRWANTAAVTTVSLSMPTTTFQATTTFSLYGVIA